jgi:hypothetical protein
VSVSNNPDRAAFTTNTPVVPIPTVPWWLIAAALALVAGRRLKQRH